jgi:hypothetical protein
MSAPKIEGLLIVFYNPKADLSSQKSDGGFIAFGQPCQNLFDAAGQSLYLYRTEKKEPANP